MIYVKKVTLIFNASLRWNLYRVGLNYNHGTGHGVGAYGFIHESPIQVIITLAILNLIMH